jgi:hypothetical protein
MGHIINSAGPQTNPEKFPDFENLPSRYLAAMRLQNRHNAGWKDSLLKHAPLVLMLTMPFASAGGCASVASQAGSAAAPSAVKGALREVNAPDDQRQLQRLADSPALLRAAQTIGEGVSLGIFNEANKLAGADANADVSTTSATTVPTTAPGATRPSSMPAGKTPGAAAVASLAGGGLNGFVRSSVQEAFLAATDPQFKAGEAAMSEAIGEGFVTGMIKVLNNKGPEIGETIRKQLGPIVQELIREQIAPAVRDMLQQQLAPAALQVWKEGAVETLKLTVRPDLQPDIQQNAQNISIGAGHGTHQVLVESGWVKPSGELTRKLKIIAWSAAAVLGLILLALFSLLVMLNLLALHHWRRRNRGRVA